MDEFIVRFADIRIKIYSQYSYMRNLCKDYIINDSEFDMEARASKDYLLEMRAEEAFSDEYCESLSIYEQIAKRLPHYRCFVFHGACISYKNKGLLFTAPSGTGKTTHIKLWKQCFPKDVDIVNGDKPIIKIENDGIRVYGSPYAGKEKWNKNRSVLLHSICIIKQSNTNSIKMLTPAEAMKYLYHQIYFSKTDRECGILSLELFDDLLTRCPMYLLECNISREAVTCSFEGMIKDE